MRVVFVGRHRPIIPRLVLYIVTFGISRRLWLYRVNKEVDGHAALGLNHGLIAALLWLPIIGPFIVQCQTTAHLNKDLHSEAKITYGPTPALCLLGLVPIVGNLFYIGWTQDRLNRYWAHEKNNLDHGIDIDVGLDKDKKFLIELRKAQEESYHAGSRFDRKKRDRQERWARRTSGIRDVQEERRQVRAAGGSTPVIPWLRPKREAPRHLRITCGRCEQKFDATQDPFAETPILCPRCGLNEILPSLRGDALKGKERVAVAALEVDCPKCDTHFHALRALAGPTELTCFECGHSETLPAGAAAQRIAAP